MYMIIMNISQFGRLYSMYTFLVVCMVPGKTTRDVKHYIETMCGLCVGPTKSPTFSIIILIIIVVNVYA